MNKKTKIKFPIKNSEKEIEILTERPELIFGVTFLLLPENFDLENEENLKAINPANNKEIPVFFSSDISEPQMGVPAHNEKDYKFAQKNNLEIKEVIAAHFIDHNNPPRPKEEGKKLVPRRAIQVILKHWSEDKVLILKWQKFDWETFIVGGVKEGEKPEEAAIRELKEETGYKNIKSIRKIAGEFHSEFFAAHKDVNRYAYVQGYYVELENGEKRKTALEEHEKFDLVWTDFDKVRGKLISDDMRIMWDNLQNDTKIFTGNGIMINSGKFDGMKSEEAREEIIKSIF